MHFYRSNVLSAHCLPLYEVAFDNVAEALTDLGSITLAPDRVNHPCFPIYADSELAGTPRRRETFSSERRGPLSTALEPRRCSRSTSVPSLALSHQATMFKSAVPHPIRKETGTSRVLLKVPRILIPTRTDHLTR